MTATPRHHVGRVDRLSDFRLHRNVHPHRDRARARRWLAANVRSSLTAPTLPSAVIGFRGTAQAAETLSSENTDTCGCPRFLWSWLLRLGFTCGRWTFRSSRRGEGRFVGLATSLRGGRRTAILYKSGSCLRHQSAKRTSRRSVEGTTRVMRTSFGFLHIPC